MPGSRPAELAHHLELMLDAALGAARALGEHLTVLLPFPVTADFDEMKRRISSWLEKRGLGTSGGAGDSAFLDLRPSRGDAPIALLAADAGLIKSGTSTLEAGILGCPHAIVYQSSWFSHFVFDHIVRLGFKGPVGLVNLVYAWMVQGWPIESSARSRDQNEPWLVREFIDYHTAPRGLQDEVVALLRDEAKRERLQQGLARLREQVLGDARTGSPSERAAREIFEVVRSARLKDRSARLKVGGLGLPEGSRSVDNEDPS
jgi:lipid-A-disaccharide synthase